MFENIFYIPRKIRIFIIAFFAFFLPASLVLLGYFAWTNTSDEVIIVTTSLVNLLIAGAGIAVLVLFTQQSTSSELQLSELDHFLTKEIPDQILKTRTELPTKVCDWSIGLDANKYHVNKIQILHFKNMPKCWYLLETKFGEIAIYISVTSYKLRISFFVPRAAVSDQEQFSKPSRRFSIMQSHLISCLERLLTCRGLKLINI